MTDGGVISVARPPPDAGEPLTAESLPAGVDASESGDADAAATPPYTDSRSNDIHCARRRAAAAASEYAAATTDTLGPSDDASPSDDARETSEDADDARLYERPADAPAEGDVKGGLLCSAFLTAPGDVVRRMDLRSSSASASPSTTALPAVPPPLAPTGDAYIAKRDATRARRFWTERSKRAAARALGVADEETGALRSLETPDGSAAAGERADADEGAKRALGERRGSSGDAPGPPVICTLRPRADDDAWTEGDGGSAEEGREEGGALQGESTGGHASSRFARARTHGSRRRDGV